MSADRPYVARCNDCNPKVVKTFVTEDGSREWGRDHEMTTKIMVGQDGHKVRYGMKAIVTQR